MKQVPRQSHRKFLNGIILTLAFLISIYSLQAQFHTQSGKFLRGIAKIEDNSDSIPHIEWQKCLGGVYNDEAQSIIETSDGGFVVAGYTSSNDGDVSGGHYMHDYWIVKLNKNGQLLWQKCLGGRNTDEVRSIAATSDGGIVVAGYTSSNNEDISGNHGSIDQWIIKLDQKGQLLWQKCLGGSSDDVAYSVIETKDRCIVVAGYTSSNDGDVTGNHGNYDYWIVKLDQTGQLLWQKCLGGSVNDEAYSIIEISDGGFVVAGSTYSNDGDVSGRHSNKDFWIVKLDQTGLLQWQKCLGGSAWDEPYSIKETSDGGFVVAGETLSNDGDVTGNHGAEDYWVVKLDHTGQIMWQKCLGGSYTDIAYSVIERSDGGFIVAGDILSNDGDVTGYHSGIYFCTDSWIVKLDRAGQLQWQKCLGGSSAEVARSIVATSDGGFAVAGYTWSNDGDVTGHHGSNYYEDFWVVKLSPEGGTNIDDPDDFYSKNGGSRLLNPDGQDLIKDIYPNPSKDEIIINYELPERSYAHLYITNILGERVKDVFSGNDPESGGKSISVNVNDLSSGTYYIILETMNGCQSKRIEVVR